MRKWMRDRLKRPKKNTEAGKSGPAQAPLQPAYYDTPEAAAPASPRILDEPEAPEPEIEARSAPDLQSPMFNRCVIGTTLQESRSSRREPRVRKAGSIRAADGGGEEVDEAGAARKPQNPCRLVALWEMAKSSPLRRSRHQALMRRCRQRRRELRKAR